MLSFLAAHYSDHVVAVLFSSTVNYYLMMIPFRLLTLGFISIHLHTVAAVLLL